MNRALKLVCICLGAFLFVTLALMLVLQSRTTERLRQENLELKQRLDAITAQAAGLTAERAGLLKLIPDPQAQTSPPLAQEQLGELLRLRGEVSRLHVDEKKADLQTQEGMQTARAKLPNAEAEFERATKLHSERLISDADFKQAEFAVKVLKAEARGDNTEVAQLKFQQAEANLARAAELRKQSLISQTEYEEYRQKAESLRAAAN